MKKFLIIAAVIAVPPLGAILALKQINKEEEKIKVCENELDKKNSEIDVLLKEKNSHWSDEQIDDYEQIVRNAD